MGFIWSLIVGGIIGAIAGAITNKGSSMGIIANVVAGLVGSAIGQALLGTWGPSIGGHGNRSIIDWCNHSCIGRIILCS